LALREIEDSLVDFEDGAQTDGGSGCTGDAGVDELLEKANLQQVTQLSTSKVYSWSGFCEAAKAAASVGLPLYAGSKVGQALSNIASLLAQAMWESGGDAPFSACDENWWKTDTETPSCTQRADGQRYDSLTTAPACSVDKQMKMTAVTSASWAKGPMKCEPGTPTAGCCWWGRGAIQTTGPHNYKLLQQDIVGKASAFSGIDLCKNPEAICEKDGMKWIGAIYYWTTIVQKASQFKGALEQFASGYEGVAFNTGCGAMVNNGNWHAAAHANEKRNANFRKIIDALKQAGMS
jgi:predicted chitinase